MGVDAATKPVEAPAAGTAPAAPTTSVADTTPATPATAAADASAAPVTAPTEAEPITAPSWDGELPSLGEQEWYSSLSEDARSAIDTGYGTVRKNVDQLLTSRTQKIKEQETALSGRETSLSTRETELTALRSQIEEEHRNNQEWFTKMLIDGPEDSVDGTPAAQVADTEVANRLREELKPWTDLGLSHEDAAAALAELPGLRERLEGQTGKMAELQAAHDAMLEDVINRAEQSIKSIDPKIVDEPAAYKALLDLLDNEAEDTFDKVYLERAISAVRVLYPDPDAPAKLPDPTPSKPPEPVPPTLGAADNGSVAESRTARPQRPDPERFWAKMR